MANSNPSQTSELILCNHVVLENSLNLLGSCSSFFKPRCCEIHPCKSSVFTSLENMKFDASGNGNIISTNFLQNIEWSNKDEYLNLMQPEFKDLCVQDHTKDNIKWFFRNVCPSILRECLNVITNVCFIILPGFYQVTLVCYCTYLFRIQTLQFPRKTKQLNEKTFLPMNFLSI